MIRQIMKHLFMSVVLILLISNCSNSNKDEMKKRITIGGKNFTEQILLANIAKIILEKKGFEVTLKTGIGSTLARKSLENAQFDLYYEYTGTAYTIFHKQKNFEIMTNPKKVYDWVKKADEKKNLVWLDPIDFNNTYVLLMQKKTAEQYDIKSISDLAKIIRSEPEKFIVALDTEFWERDDGFKKVMKTYNFKVAPDKVKKMSIGLTYKALKDSMVDIAMGFATDGRISAFGFVGLVDDKNFFPVYHPAPVIRKETLEKYPEVRSTLKSITEALTTSQMQKLNAAVDIDKQNEYQVAKNWLLENKLIR